jgi:hypothetical protein
MVAIVATIFLATAAAAAAEGSSQGTSVAPLTGESLLASEIGNPGTSTVTGTCNPLGTSTFNFTVTGTATGPYPGTFTETGTVTIGPLVNATSFNSTFTINSPAGNVTGTKDLTGFEATSLGLCGTAAFPTGGADSLHFEGTVSYTATITTPTGTGTDSGESFVNLQDAQVRGVEGFNGFAFAESYTSTATPVGCEEEDNDHQGDCDDDDQGEN